MNESLVKYLAGLLDADGSASFSYKRDIRYPDKLYATLRISLASSDVIDRHGFVEGLPELTKMGSTSRYGSKLTGGDKKYVSWTVMKQAHVEMLMPRLIKHMVVKGQHWQWMLETWRAHRGRVISDEEKEVLEASSKESRRTRRGPLKPKNHPTWAWLAGYLDGDGYYTCNPVKGTQRLQMRIGAVAHKNDKHVLEFIQKALGGEICEHGQSAQCLNWYRQMTGAHRNFALNILPNLAKHSRLKRYRIDQLIHVHQQRLSAQAPDGGSDSLAAL